MKKRNVAILVILAVVLTAVNTFFISNVVSLRIGDKVVVSKSEYASLTSLKGRFTKLLDLEKFIEDNYYKDVDVSKFDDYAIKGIFESLGDPYSIYMTQAEYKEFNEVHEGVYSGIGVVISPGDDNLITVVSPIEGSPGEAAGLKPGDKIIKVNGEVFSGEQLDLAITKIKGPEGTTVTLTVRRDGQDEFDVEIIRATIVIKAVESEMLEGSDGYIKIKSFDDKVSDEFETALKELLSKNADSLIIDLRNNPGGSLYEVVKIADRLLGEQVIVSTKDRAGEEQVIKSDAKKVDLPIIVLVNEGSASASEILTGAIKDTKAGVIIGSTTFGKGIVQSVEPLEDGSAVKLTTSEYFTPSGENIHKKGIKPDIDESQIKDAGYEITDDIDGVLQYSIDYLEKK